MYWVGDFDMCREACLGLLLLKFRFGTCDPNTRTFYFFSYLIDCFSSGRERLATCQCPRERQLVGKLQVSTHRHARRNAADAEPYDL